MPRLILASLRHGLSVRYALFLDDEELFTSYDKNFGDQETFTFQVTARPTAMPTFQEQADRACEDTLDCAHGDTCVCRDPEGGGQHHPSGPSRKLLFGSMPKMDCFCEPAV